MNYDDKAPFLLKVVNRLESGDRKCQGKCLGYGQL